MPLNMLGRQKIIVSFKVKKDEVRICVQDFGIGIEGII